MSLCVVHSDLVYDVPPELTQHIAQFVVDDPSVDDETLKACSLAFKGLSQLFQHALTSRNSAPAEILISRDCPQGPRNERFRALLDILKTNPSFARSVSQLKVTITMIDSVKVEAVILDDSVCSTLSLLTRLSSLSVGGLFNDGSSEETAPDFIPGLDSVLHWAAIPEKLRTVLENIIQSPFLQHLELRLMAVPWPTFFGPRETLDRLTLRKVVPDVEMRPIWTPPPGPFPNLSTLASISIGHLDTCQWSAYALDAAMSRNCGIHLGKVQTLEIHVPREDILHNADFSVVNTILHQPELDLQGLLVCTNGCTSQNQTRSGFGT